MDDPITGSINSEEECSQRSLSLDTNGKETGEDCGPSDNYDGEWLAAQGYTPVPQLSDFLLSDLREQMRQKIKTSSFGLDNSLPNSFNPVINEVVGSPAKNNSQKNRVRSENDVVRKPAEEALKDAVAQSAEIVDNLEET